MIVKLFTRKIVAFSLLVLFAFSSVISARPNQNPFWQQDDEVVKLPPVNWIRSRTIDVKHIAIDLKFDGKKNKPTVRQRLRLRLSAIPTKLRWTRRRCKLAKFFWLPAQI